MGHPGAVGLVQKVQPTGGGSGQPGNHVVGQCVLGGADQPGKVHQIFQIAIGHQFIHQRLGA